MIKKIASVGALCLAWGLAWAQVGDGFVSPNRPAVNPVSGEPMTAKVAGLKQDNEALRKDVNDLTLRMELLERQKANAEEGKTPAVDWATREELKLMEARLNDAMMKESARVQAAILEEIRAAKKAAVAPAAPVAASKPAETPKAERPAVSEAERQSYMKEGVRYTVQPGDTLTSIARKNKSSVRAIMVVNDIESPNKLWVGKELFVPVVEK